MKLHNLKFVTLIKSSLLNSYGNAHSTPLNPNDLARVYRSSNDGASLAYIIDRLAQNFNFCWEDIFICGLWFQKTRQTGPFCCGTLKMSVCFDKMIRLNTRTPRVCYWVYLAELHSDVNKTFKIWHVNSKEKYLFYAIKAQDQKERT